MSGEESSFLVRTNTRGLAAKIMTEIPMLTRLHLFSLAMSEDFPPKDEDQPASIELSAKSDTILYQMRGLFVGYAGLEYLNRVIQQSFLFDRSKT
ncbi:MAG: hypothetical protein ACREBS_09045, partial [Nitrososphaerales archaeon]